MARKPKAPMASWIVEQRKARGLKPADVAARLAVAETTIRGWETGRGVSPENVTALERLFGVSAPDAPQPADMASLVAAISELAGAIRAERAERLEWERGFLEAMRELARAREPQDDLARELRAGARL